MDTSFDCAARLSDVSFIPAKCLTMTTFYTELEFRVFVTAIFITIMSTSQKQRGLFTSVFAPRLENFKRSPSPLAIISCD